MSLQKAINLVVRHARNLHALHEKPLPLNIILQAADACYSATVFFFKGSQ